MFGENVCFNLIYYFNQGDCLSLLRAALNRCWKQCELVISETNLQLTRHEQLLSVTPSSQNLFFFSHLWKYKKKKKTFSYKKKFE